MFKTIARLLPLSMLLGLLFATSFADPSSAQTFPTPSKVLCSGEVPTSVTGPFTCPSGTATTTPNPAVTLYYYAITLQPNVSGPFNLLENLPGGFNLTGVTCTISAGSGAGQAVTPAPTATLVGQLATIGTINMVSGQTIVCFVRGTFNNPGTAINTVTVANTSGNVSFPGSYSVSVNSTAILPADLSVVKTLTFPTGTPPTLNVANGPQQATYSIVIKNNGAEAVSLGQMFELVDVVSVPNTSAPLQVQMVAGSTTCTPYTPPLQLTTSCLSLTPTQSVSTSTDVTTSDLGLATWKFPTTGASAAGYIPVGGTITLTYKVEVRKHPDLYCSKGSEALHNKAFFRLTPINGITITENTAPNNTSITAPDVVVNTGQPIDPECDLPTQGPIVVTKEQIAPTPSTPVPWGGNVTYRIRVKNNDANGIAVQLRDYVMEWQGTPEFTAQVVSWSCTITSGAPCGPPPAPVGAAVQLAYYFDTATVWNKFNIPVPGNGGVAEIIVTINYVRTSCDSFTAGGNLIRNYARAKYVWNAAPVFSEAFVDTTMAVPPACKLEVRKKVVDIDPTKVAPFGSQISYAVSYRNADPINPVIIGTLFDAVRLQQSNYATQLPFTANYNCTVTAGAVTGSAPGVVPTTGLASGNIVYTTNPAQGARIFQNPAGSTITFGSNSILMCQVVLTVQRPAPNDQYCMSSQEPRLENVGLMDVSTVYNPSLSWPPSGSYNANAPFGVSHPTPLTNWQAVTVKLPKCYKLIVNKTVQPGLTWAPGGPSPLTYSIEVTNAGDTLTGSMGSNGWNGLLLGDAFLPGSPYNPVAGSVTVTSSCSSPSATWGSWSGVPAGNLSFLPISNFPGVGSPGAPCKITIQFKVAGPFTPGQICNKAGAAMTPASSSGGTDTADWYANDPNPALLSSTVCLPVLGTSKFSVRKEVVDKAGVQLPANMQFPMNATCVTPLNTFMGGLTYVPINATAGVMNPPIGSVCTVNELVSWLTPPTGESKCKAPAVPAWHLPVVYSPGPSITITAEPADNIITVTNTIDCVTPPVNTLTVNKTFGPPSIVPQLPASATFTVEVGCDPAPSGTFSMTTASLSGFLSNIPVGTLCKIHEQQPTGTKIPAGCHWEISYPLGESIVIPATGNPTLEVHNQLICQPDLRVDKVGPTPVPGSTGLFSYTITVSSPGGPFTIPAGGLTLNDFGTLGSGMFGGLTVVSGPWTCSALTCTYTGSGPTAMGQILGTFTVNYFAWIPRPYVNCARVALAPSTGLVESNLANNLSCVPNGPLPQANVGIVKTGPFPVPGSPGQFTFVLTVKNGPTPFTLTNPNGLLVTDSAPGMVGTFLNVTATPPASWSCVPSGVNAGCTYTPVGTIGANQVLGTITITAYRPLSLGSFTNCATVAFSPVTPLVDSVPANNQSCVNVSDVKMATVIPPPPGGPPIVVPPPPGGPTCDPDTTTRRGNTCVCKFGNMQRSSPSACACPAGTNLVAGKGCVRPLDCRPPMVPNAAATACVCPPGLVQRGRECVKPPECQAPMVPGPVAGSCTCPPGTVQRGRECVKQPVCTPPMVANAAGVCGCPEGTTLKGRECVKTVVCRPPLVANATGTCACPEGTELKGRECMKVDRPAPRERGEERGNTREQRR